MITALYRREYQMLPKNRDERPRDPSHEYKCHTLGIVREPTTWPRRARTWWQRKWWFMYLAHFVRPVSVTNGSVLRFGCVAVASAYNRAISRVESAFTRIVCIRGDSIGWIPTRTSNFLYETNEVRYGGHRKINSGLLKYQTYILSISIGNIKMPKVTCKDFRMPII